MASILDTDAIAARLAARLSMRGQHNDGDDDIAALLAEVATLQKNYQLRMESHQGMANENLRLGGIIQALREALKPFAALLNKAHRDRPDESPFYRVDDAEVTVGDLRKAWAVSRLTEEPK